MGLGWLRLALSLLVIDAHYGGFRTLLQPRLVAAFGVERLAYIGEGEVAIAGFFVISGYVITYVLAHKYEATTWRGIGIFYTGRALRIYPLYLLVFGAYWLALAAIGSAPVLQGQTLVNNLLLLPLGVATLLGDHVTLGAPRLTGQLLIGPAWTLCFDLLLYLLAPFFVLHRRALLVVSALGVAWFAGFAVVLDARPPIWFAYLYTSPVGYVFAFACGALAFHYGHLVSGRRGLATLAAMAVAWITFLPLGLPNSAVNQLLAILLLTVVVAVLKDYGSGERWDRLFGDLTYATYLLHLPLLLLLERMGVAGAAWWGLAATYGIALLLLHAFEYPLDRWRARLHRRLSAGAARPARGLGVATLATLVVVGAAAGVSFVRNGLGGGVAVHPAIADCPAAWQCAADLDRVAVTLRGAGSVSATPALHTDQRLLADITMGAGSGSAFAGFRAGGLTAGLRRGPEGCRLVVARDGNALPAPDRWNGDCAATHRFVLDGSTGTLVVAIDSLWVFPTTQPVGTARLVVEADAAADGDVRVRGLYTTSRSPPVR